MEKIKGTGVALITPFNEDLSVNYLGLERLINHQIDGGIDYLVLMGTTGESAVLSKSEKQEIIAFCKKLNNEKLPIVLGIGGNNTLALVEEIKNTDFTGIDAVLSVSPAYNKPTQEGLFAHFKAINNASLGIPVMIYNIPPRSIVDMSLEVMAELSKLENIMGVKDATSDLSRVKKQKEQCSKGFLQFSGEDITAYEFMQNGGNGCISVTANVLPRLCSEFQNLCLEGNFDEALKIHKKLEPMHNALFIETSPAPVKYVLSKMGLIEDELRLPLVSIRQETKDLLDKVISDLDMI